MSRQENYVRSNCMRFSNNDAQIYVATHYIGMVASGVNSIPYKSVLNNIFIQHNKVASTSSW